ncbi:peptide deformylase, partial [Candidatus Parabeggiatoa sp. HSG14]|uniref:peptide deformylase n=1 Tax=Candidatus Parabeggiatoa sp. HSG14 TaxID=3055593 RepID=UPI0025A800DB|nr:peptide deformylase [Thiotrichales bacterium HSG14]
PDARLRTIAKPVKQIDNTTRKIVADMFETMYEAPGIGLAATQVNIHKQIITIDLSEEKNQPLCFINPNILSKEGTQCIEEGCLSLPDVFEKIERAERITVQALNQQGEDFTLTTDGLLAVCILHEIDHLKGKLFVDYLSSFKRQRIRKKMVKNQRQKTL